MLRSNLILCSILLLFSTINFAKEKAVEQPVYLKKSEKVLESAIKQRNQSSQDYTNNPTTLFEDALEASNTTVKDDPYKGQPPNQQKIDEYITQFKKESVNPRQLTNGCDTSTSLTGCEQDAVLTDKKEVFVYVSSSMPDALLANAFDEAARHNATVVVRGVLKGKTLPESMLPFHKARKLAKLAPNVVIDPRPFNAHKVTTVPAITIKQFGESLTIPGVLNIDYALKKFKEGEAGMQPKSGTTYPIAELDFVEDMKQRVTKIDFQALAKKGVNKVWKHQKYATLPKAKTTESYSFNPSFIVKEDVLMPDGRLIAAAGTRFNPQKVTPLTKTLIFFDATDPKQIALIKPIVQRHYDNNKAFKLMATKLPSNYSWDKFHSLRKDLGGKLFVAQQDVVKRFHLKTLPSLIEGYGEKLKVTQLSE